MWSIFAVTSTFTFNESAGMFSGPAALSLLICLMTMLISPIVGGQHCVASILGGFSRVGRSKSFLKYLTHLFRFSSVLVINLPSLFFTGRSGVQ
ncbi:unnamed protein product [Schistosoma curassoni]|uniref:Secreted protein n=1 Tax=Schistosoma curassoni TaxID=6186 RepID=A0A183KSN4_9TREM|nr:unnamed protein product [Schistosoma curassoni]